MYQNPHLRCALWSDSFLWHDPLVCNTTCTSVTWVWGARPHTRCTSTDSYMTWGRAPQTHVTDVQVGALDPTQDARLQIRIWHDSFIRDRGLGLLTPHKMRVCTWALVSLRASGESWCADEWVMSYVWVSHVTFVRESCHVCEWVMSRVGVSHVTCVSHDAQMSESCRMCGWVMSRVWVGHVTHVNEPCCTCEWVMSHMWISHVTHVNESCHTLDDCAYVPRVSHDAQRSESHVWMNYVTH